jgi:CTP synthase (UTP-ammonia lyase)
VGSGLVVLLDRKVAGRYADATISALRHALDRLACDLPLTELPTSRIDPFVAERFDGIVVGPGSPYENADGVIGVIRAARERGVPLVGT